MQKLVPRTGFVFALVGSVLLAALTGLHGAPAATRLGFDDLRRISATADAEPADGSSVELVGYMLPADQEGDLVYEFMLFRDPGACSHMAPPPANQIVRVIPDEPFAADRMYQSVRVTGTLVNEHNKAQLYVLDGVRVVESAFRISEAAVESVDIAPSARPRDGKSPWKFIKN